MSDSSDSARTSSPAHSSARPGDAAGPPAADRDSAAGALRVIGHRGASAHEPENSLRSFRRALDEGADGFECDVHLTRDGEVAVMHDEGIDRTAAASSPRRTGAIAALTRTELDDVLLAQGEHVPSLAAALDVRDELEGAQALVEIKVPAAGAAVGHLLTARYGSTWEGGVTDAPVLVISFHAEALAALRAEAPQVPIGLIVSKADDAAFATLERLDAEVLSVDIETITEGVVQRVRSLGRETNVWTVNTEEQLDRAVAVGAEIISSDDPAWARAGIASRLGTR